MGDMADMYDYDYDPLDMDCEPETIVLLKVKVLHQTERAVLIEHKGKQAWFPKDCADLEWNEALRYDAFFNPKWVAPAVDQFDVLN